MKRFILLYLLLSSLYGCEIGGDSITGSYELEVSGLKNVSRGVLEIVGEADDYFGRITFNAKKKRVYEIGLISAEHDSLNFILPGKGGFLKIKRDTNSWNGKFKYFGIEADIVAKRAGPAPAELQALVDLKPLAKGIISTDAEESFPSFEPISKILYFTRGQSLYYSELSDSSWSEPEMLSFSEGFDDSAPYIYNRGNSLLFTSSRPLGNSQFKKKNLWVAHKSNTSISSSFSL